MVFGSVFKKIKSGLAKTRDLFTSKLKTVLRGKRFTPETLEQLEELMISWDMGVSFATQCSEKLEEAYRNKEFNEDEVIQFLKTEIRSMISSDDNSLQFADTGPTVILVCGVNGAGKTTSIAKLAALLKNEGKTVLLAAGDTFRAAAVQQLSIWAERIGVDIIRHADGADPAAVCFDALDAGVARGVDVIIVDTAGRLHTQINLMNELEKINRVIQKKIPDAPHETLLVIDGTTGQNGVQQAKKFNESIAVTGLILSKLDGTAKGGIVVTIKHELGIPVKFVGLGESVEDIAHFNPDEFVSALFED